MATLPSLVRMRMILGMDDQLMPQEWCLRLGLCGGEVEEFGYALGVLVGLEAGEQVVDEMDAAGCADAAGQEL